LGRYRLLQRLGAGGFGVVWRARDEELGREVALKRVPREAWGATAAGELGGNRARREALASARLTHPAIAALYEAREDDDCLYLISELVEGVALKARIAADSLEDREIVAIGLALCEALMHAHARGVIHRDVTPANVIVLRAAAEPGQAPAKLTDFGNALMVSEDDRRAELEATLSDRSEVLGTLAYMAPEQAGGARAGPETDLYALALVLYEAFSGTNPLRAESVPLTSRRLGTRLPSLALRRPGLPRPLSHAIDRALLPERERRGTVAELAGALRLARSELAGEGALPWNAPRRPRVARRPGRTMAGEPWAVAATAVPPPPGPAPRRPQALAPWAPPTGPPAQVAPSIPAETAGAEPRRRSGRRGRPLPRVLWWAGALTIVIWQALVGRPGVALLLGAAALPLVVLPPRAGPSWMLAAFAPALGLLGLAGAYPAIGGQAARWSTRAGLGALGYWWLLLAQALVGATLWLWPAERPLPPSGRWVSSASAAAEHVVRPLLTVATLEGALLWAGACVLLPWLVRGRSVWLDVVFATIWSAALVAAEPLFDSGAGSATATPGPRNALLGAILGGALAVCARALRGPVRHGATAAAVVA
jgi:tRNA A-37 threonylcarbamoyl transferase component Bud32